MYLMPFNPNGLIGIMFGRAIEHDRMASDKGRDFWLRQIAEYVTPRANELLAREKGR